MRTTCGVSCPKRRSWIACGLRLRWALQHRRAVHLVPAQEDRQRPRADDPHNDARRRLCPSNRPADAMVAHPQSSPPARRRRSPRAGRCARGCSVDRWCCFALVCLAIGGGHRVRLLQLPDRPGSGVARGVVPLDDDDGQPTTPGHLPGLGPGHQRRWARQQEAWVRIPRLRSAGRSAQQWCSCAGGAVSAGRLCSGGSRSSLSAGRRREACWRPGLDGAPVSTTIDGDGYRAVASVTPWATPWSRAPTADVDDTL